MSFLENDNRELGTLFVSAVVGSVIGAVMGIHVCIVLLICFRA